MNPLDLNMLVVGVVGGGGAGETRWGDACWWVGEASRAILKHNPLRQAGQFQPMGEPAVQILRK